MRLIARTGYDRLPRDNYLLGRSDCDFLIGTVTVRRFLALMICQAKARIDGRSIVFKEKKRKEKKMTFRVELLHLSSDFIIKWLVFVRDSSVL
jgi:hypothetical protein